MSTQRGLSWLLGVKVADEGSRPLLNFARTAAQASKIAVEASKKIEAQSKQEAAAAKAAAALKERAARDAAEASKKAAAAEVAAAKAAGTANTKEARDRLASAKRVAQAESRAAAEARKDAQAATRNANTKVAASAKATRAAEDAARRQAKAEDELQREQRQTETASRKARAAQDAHAKSSGRLSGSLSTLAKRAAAVGAAYVSIQGIKNAVSSTEELAKVTMGLANNYGFATDEASRWAAQAKVRGIDAGKLSVGFNSLSKAINAVGDADRKRGQALGKITRDEKRRIEALAGKADKDGGAKAAVKAAELERKSLGAQADAFDKLGISVKTVKQAKGDISSILPEIADGMQKMGSGAERNAVGLKLFGRQWQTLRPLLSGGSVALREQLDLADKYGITLEEADTKGLAKMLASQREFKFAMLGLETTIGKALMPIVTKLQVKISELAQEFRSNWPEIKKQIEPVAKSIESVVSSASKFVGKHPELLKIAAAVTAVGLAAKTIKFAGAITGVTDLANGVRRLRATASAPALPGGAAPAAGRGAGVRRVGGLGAAGALGAGASFLTAGKDTSLSGIATGAASGAMAGSVAGPWGMAIGAALGAAVPIVRKHWGEITDASKTALDWLEDAVGDVRKWFRDAWDGLPGIAQGALRGIPGLVKRQIGSLKEIFGGVGTAAKGVFRTVGAIFRGDWRAAWSGVKTVIRGGLGALKGLLLATTAPVREGASRMFNGIKGPAGDAVAWVAAIPGRIGRKIGEGLGGLRSVGTSIVDAIVSGIKASPGKIKDAISDLIPDPVKDVAGAAGGFLSGLVETAKKIPKIPGRTGGRFTGVSFSRFATGGLLTAAMALGVPAFASGGMVPAVVSPGELIEYGGASGIVPGARVAADTVPMMLPVGARVFTDHGQSLLSMGASPEEALSAQLPHFNTGGEATKKGKKKPVRSARVGYTVFDDPPPGAFGSLTNGYAELGTATRSGRGTGRGWIARALGLKGELPANTPLTITIGSRSATLRKRDRGYGQGGDGTTSDPRYALDVWKDSWAKLGLNGNGKGMATVALGTAAQVKASGTKGVGYSYTERRKVGKSATRGGLLDDAYAAGIGAVETFGSRAAARRAGALSSPIRSALDELQDSYTRKVEVAAAASRSGATSSSGSGAKGIKPGGGWGGSENIARGLIAGLTGGQNVSYKRAATHRLSRSNPSSDHNTANTGAFAVDMAPGGGSLFQRIASRAGIAARMGQWNKFNNQPIAGYRTQLLWHAPDGSHKDHVHLGVRKLRRGGLIGAVQRFGTGGAVRQPKAVTAALAGVTRSTSNKHLDALSEAIETATMRQIAALRASLLKGIRPGGDAAANARLRAALSVVEIDVAGRIQERLIGLGKTTADWARKTGESSHWMRRSGIDEGSSKGIAISQINANTYLRSQSNSELKDANAAIRLARIALRDATNKDDRATAKSALTSAKDAKSGVLDARTEARTVLEELKLRLPQVKAGERVGALDFADAMLGLRGVDASTDRVSLGARHAEFAKQLAEATASGNKAWATDAATTLRGIESAIRDLPKVASAQRTADNDYQMAWAQLTETLDDDRALLAEREKQAWVDLAEAGRMGDQAWATELLGTIKQTKDALESLDTGQQERDARDQELIDLLKQTNENQQKLLAGSAQATSALQAAIAATASGYIGSSVMRASGTPAFAGKDARY